MARKALDIAGKRSGYLTIIEQVEIGSHGSKWKCICDCGVEKVIDGRVLKEESVKSCGCKTKEMLSDHFRIHGMKSSKLYRQWNSMKSRCKYTGKGTENHNGKGIKACDEWADSFVAFKDWAYANGYQEGLTLDRINNDGDYTPENCRWVDWIVQNNNKSDNHILEINGECKTVADWARHAGLNYQTLQSRLRRGEPVCSNLLREKRGW